MWLTAAAHSVYKFVCLRQTGSTIKLTTAEATALVEAEQAALDEGLVPPSPPKEVGVMQFYAAICVGTPMLLVAGMLLPGEFPTFSYQTLHTTGWCTINLMSPVRSFTLFYLPLIFCMFYQAGAYYFCFTQVKVKQGLLGKIDNEIMYDASAALVKKKTEAEYDRVRRASSVVRLALLATSACWTPQCIFGVMMVAAKFGVVGGDPESLGWLSKLRSISTIINPMFGVALFLVIESCFNFRLRYSQAFHQKLRRIRYKLCGKMGTHKVHLDKIEVDRDEDEDIPTYEKIASAIYNGVWQLIELAAFAPWAVVVWVPMDTFRSEVKSNKKLTYISVMYMIFIALPSLVMFVFLPSFYNVVDATLLHTDDVTVGDPKENFTKGVAALYVIYLGLVVFIAWLHLEHRKHVHLGGILFYVAVAAAPCGFMAVAFDFAWEFIEDTEKSPQDALDLKHKISIGFVYAYLAGMFAVVAGTLFISRRKTELNFIEHPVSHAGLTPQNGRALISSVLENIQLSSLLLAHSAFSGDYEADVEPMVNTTEAALALLSNATVVLCDEACEAEAAAAAASAAASAQLDAMTADDWAADFSVMKLFLFDLSFFKAIFAEVADMAFDIKLSASTLAVGIWVVIVMVPIVLDTVTLARSKTFLAVYGKLAFVQDTLAGPLFLIILQTFLSTLDCTKSPEGFMVLELKPSQQCWDGTHLLYAATGLTCLMSFVPLACLTMTTHEDPTMHFRYTPLYYRVEVIAKGIMAMTTQFTNTMSPIFSFPLIMCMSIWMILATKEMMPCCIVWANRIKMNGYLMQLWTGFSGMVAAYFWELEMLNLGGVPLTPVGVMGIGWVVITVQNLKEIKDDKLMLVQPTKKDKDGPALAWSDYMDAKQTSRDSIQINKLNGMRLAKRPDDTKIHYNTHHEVLVMIYILRSHASAATKQRALQILAAATGSTSAEAHDYNSDESSSDEDDAAGEVDDFATVGVNSEIEVEDNIDSGQTSPGGTRIKKKKQANISVQTRRRLLGFQGDEHDADAEDYHFPEVVLVSPPSIISLLSAEFHLTRERDQSGTDKFGAMWKIDKEELSLGDGDPNESKKDKKERKKKEKKEEADKLKKNLKDEVTDLTPEQREEQKAKRLKDKEDEIAKREEEKAMKEDEKKSKKEAKHLKKTGQFEEESNETDIPLKTAEILFLLKRAKALIGQDLLDSFTNELPNRLLTKAHVNFIRHNPPDVLRLQVSGAGTTTMGIDNSGADGTRRAEFHDDHLLEHILELPEDRIYNGTNEDENEALSKIRSIRRMYSSEHVHKLLEDIITLPDETLERTDDMFDMKLQSDDPNEMNEETRLQNEHLKKIKRLEQEKLIIENEIAHERDKALSNVSKVYLIRVLAIYAEDKAFAARIVDLIGPVTLIEYLMHGDVNLQAAATVCIYQLARFDPDCLDALEHTPGGMVFVATRLTDPDSNSIVMHRIAADLLVELAKRFELRKAMIGAGLIGPLLLLVDAYAQLLKPDDNDVGQRLREKVKDAVVTFTPRHHAVDTDGNLVKEAGDHHKSAKTTSTLMDTNEIEPWCPFSLKGTLPHATHVLLSVMRVFQQLSDEDKFRSEFVGRHKGLTWIRDHCYQIDTDDAKVMSMRLLLGISVDPFGFWDIMEDSKMLSFYIQMMKYKEGVSNWQVELEPVLKPDVWTNIEEEAQVKLRAAREAGDRTIPVLEMKGVNYEVDMNAWSRTFKATGRQQPVRIEPMALHSRDMVLRMRMHRVAQFLDLKHHNGLKLSSQGHKMRLVVVEKMSTEETRAHNMAHDANLLEVVRERVLDECFVIISEASLSDHEPVRVAAVSVLTSVCGTVMHLEDAIFDRVFEHMHLVRQNCIDAKDMVMYEAVSVSMVAMGRNHRKGQVVDRLHSPEEIFEQMWMYHHMLGKDLKQVVQTPFWRRVQEVVTPDLVKLVTDAPNTSHSHAEASIAYCHQLTVKSFFEAKKVKARDEIRAKEIEQGHYAVTLKHTTRDKIDEGVKRATEFSRKLAQHKKQNRKEKKAEKKAEKEYDALLSRQVAAKDVAMEEHDEVIKYKDAELDQQLKEEENVKANTAVGAAAGAFGVTEVAGAAGVSDGDAAIKFGNPLVDMDDESPPSPDANAQAADGMTAAPLVIVDAPVNSFEEKRKQAAVDKKENAKKEKEEAKAKKKADAEARKEEKKAKKELKNTSVANPLQTEGTEDGESADGESAKGGKGAAAGVAAGVAPGGAAAVQAGAESEEDEVELEFNAVLPAFIRLVYKLPADVEAIEGALSPKSDIRQKHKQMYDGAFSQGELFNGCPSYDHTAQLQVTTPMGDIMAEKVGHLSVVRGTKVDRWFLCADEDHLDEEEAHDLFLITPSGNLPIGEFPWRLQGGGDVRVLLEACVSTVTLSCIPALPACRTGPLD